MGRYDFGQQKDMKGTDSWKWDKEGKECPYPLGVADTDFLPPPEVTEAVMKKAVQGNFAYGVMPQAFYDSVSRWYKKRHDADVDADWVTYSPGLIVAIKMLMEAVSHVGDNVIIQPPVYFNFSLIISRNGRNILENTLIYENEGYRIDFEDLERKAADPRTTMMIFCNPHNPVAHAWSREDVERVAEICRRNHVFVVSDEAHSDILYQGTRHVPFICVSRETAMNSASINSAGKTFNTNGLYVSYAIIPNRQIRDAFEIAYANHHFDFSMIGVPAQIAAYEHGDAYTDELNAYLWDNIMYLKHFLEEKMPEVRMVKPNATYLMWLDFHGWDMDSDQVDGFFRSAGVALNKGSIYGAAGDGFMRLNVACSRSVLEEAMEAVYERYKEFFNK